MYSDRTRNPCKPLRLAQKKIIKTKRGYLRNTAKKKMAKFMNVAIFVAVAAAAILQITDAASYTVGASTGWTRSPTGGASFYSNWAENITFRVNDVLVFNFATGSHAVVEITEANFNSCDVSNNLEVWSTGPASITLNRTGNFYFACPFTGHCASGQKLSVSVSSGTSSPAASPSSPSGGGTTPGTTAPPPSGSATSLATATFSVLLMIVTVNLLF